MFKLSYVINEQWLDASSYKINYSNAKPFPHIVLTNFIKEDILKRVSREFPDLHKQKDNVIKFANSKENKLAGAGMQLLSPAALELNTYLQSDIFMSWLNELTDIKESLIADPYLSGGGYHEIKAGGYLKVHADFNKHPKLNLDRRLNLLIYLNEDWNDEWGGALQLYDIGMENAVQSIFPRFNTAVLFSTTSYSYHGHPDPLKCPENRSRKSLAYYYYSTGRPENEMLGKHSTLFKERKGEIFDPNKTVIKKVDQDDKKKDLGNKAKIESKKSKNNLNLKNIIWNVTPPILIKVAKVIQKKDESKY